LTCFTTGRAIGNKAKILFPGFHCPSHPMAVAAEIQTAADNAELPGYLPAAQVSGVDVC